MTDLKQTALSLPTQPGVYIMMDASGAVIYVGKAKNLKSRVCQYFQDAAGAMPKTQALVSQISKIDVIVADNEFEALVLECSLIKHHQPKYNIRLKDDKGYPFIWLPDNMQYPRFKIVAKPGDSGRFFGPYGGRTAARGVIDAVSQALMLPVCRRRFPRDIGKERPCLQFHMGKCMAPCRGDVTPGEYMEVIRQATAVLEGKFQAMADELGRQMEEASEALLFEKAATLRDRRKAIVSLGSRQKVVSAGMADTDVFGMYEDETGAYISVLHYIGGLLLDRDTAKVERTLVMDDPAETVVAFIKQYYYNRVSYPRVILLPRPHEDGETVAGWLSGLAGHPVDLVSPQRGDRKKLVYMAETNAREEAGRQSTKEEKTSARLTALMDILSLPALPRRIEAYDISHTGGDCAVGAMVVFYDAAPRKSGYRRFRVKSRHTADDYRSMGEVLCRRFKALLAGEPGFATAPDLLLIDGGSAHAAAAEAVLSELGLEFPVFGMVKDDRHRTRALVASDGREVGLTGIPALFALVGRIQEEVHRFAVAYHQKARSNSKITSQLDAIPGVGLARRTALLKTFKTMKALKQADVEQLSAIVPKNVAVAIRTALQG